MKRNLTKFAIGGIFITCILLSACKKGIPRGIIKPSEMENVLYDYQMAQTMSGDLSYDDEYKKALYTDYVFRKYNITQAQFDSSMVWYTREAEELTIIYENVKKRLKEQQNVLNHQIALRDKKPLITAEGDTVDVWYADRMYRLTDSPLTNKLEFHVPADVNFKIHDSFIWKLRYTFPQKENTGSVIMALSVYFENDSVVSSVKYIKHSGITSIRLKSDSTFNIKEVRGFVYFNGMNGKSVILDQITLVRYHETENERKGILDKDTLKNKPVTGEKIKNSVDSASVQGTGSTEKPPVRITPREMNHPRAKRP